MDVHISKDEKNLGLTITCDQCGGQEFDIARTDYGLLAECSNQDCSRAFAVVVGPQANIVDHEQLH
jgi:hypothetical protein